MPQAIGQRGARLDSDADRLAVDLEVDGHVFHLALFHSARAARRVRPWCRRATRRYSALAWMSACASTVAEVTSAARSISASSTAQSVDRRLDLGHWARTIAEADDADMGVHRPAARVLIVEQRRGRHREVAAAARESRKPKRRCAGQAGSLISVMISSCSSAVVSAPTKKSSARIVREPFEPVTAISASQVTRCRASRRRDRRARCCRPRCRGCGSGSARYARPRP